VQPPAPPPQTNSDNRQLAETPNDFHFTVKVGTAETSVHAFWDSKTTPDLPPFVFHPLIISGKPNLDLNYQLEANFLTVTDVTDPGVPNVLYAGPLSTFNPADIGGNYFNQATSDVSTMVEVQPPSLLGDYDNDHVVGAGDLNVVLTNWGKLGNQVSNQWVNDIPLLAGFGGPEYLLVGAQQLNLVLQNWGHSSTFAVPEPHVGTLCLTLAPFVLLRIRGRFLRRGVRCR